MAEFRPDLVLISAGFDSRMGDPLGRFRLTDADFSDLTAILLEIAGKWSRGRLVSILEGGYDLGGLSSAVYAHTHSL
jgi:acetoin utilization deacetylase AcuC-like enzyme